MRDFEFDKVVLAAALGIFTIIFSWNVGNMLYVPELYPKKRGYEVAVVAENAGAPQAEANTLPEKIDIAQIMSVADAKAGEEVFKKCMVCHAGEKGGKNKIGPHLWGILNANVARNKDFAYSNAMLARGESGATWTYEDLYRYLYSPKKYVPGTKMAFMGIKNDTDRANLIAYLRLLSDTPVTLPKDIPVPAPSPKDTPAPSPKK